MSEEATGDDGDDGDGGDAGGDAGGNGGDYGDKGDEEDKVEDEVVDGLTYHEQLEAVRSKVKALEGTQTTTRSGNQTMHWEVIAEHVVQGDNERDPATAGLKPEVKEEIENESDGLTTAAFFLKIMFGNDWQSKTGCLNKAIERHNVENGNVRDVKDFSYAEFQKNGKNYCIVPLISFQ